MFTPYIYLYYTIRKFINLKRVRFRLKGTAGPLKGNVLDHASLAGGGFVALESGRFVCVIRSNESALRATIQSLLNGH